MTSFQPETWPARLSVADLVARINATTSQVRLVLDGSQIHVIRLEPASGGEGPQAAGEEFTEDEIQLLDDLTPAPRSITVRTPLKPSPVAVTVFSLDH